MEPITHILTGACIARAGLNRKTALATLTLAISAEIPDVDIVTLLGGPVVGFAHHRGITHSFLGVPFDAALGLGVSYLLWRCWHWWRDTRRKKKSIESGSRESSNADTPSAPWRVPRWGLLYIYACIGALSHLLLDFINAYGVRPFAPFSEKWYSWDIVSIIEPMMLAVLILGLGVPALFGLINEEIGARGKRQPFRGRAGAMVALLLMVALWAVRDFEHRRAIAALETFTYDGEAPLRASAYPYAVNPFQWHGVVETNGLFKLLPLDALNGEVDPQGTGRTRYKPEETPASLAAKNSYLGRVYLDWARYPITETEQHRDPGKGYTVRLYDARYAYPDRTALAARVELDEKLNVVRQCIGQRCQ